MLKLLLTALLLALLSMGAIAQLSDDSRRKLAAMINLSGQLCARVVSATAIGPDVYTVQCVRYRDGTGSAAYEINLKTGMVK